MRFAASLPAAFAAHAAARPEEPWFFVRSGWDWAWAPWREVAEQARGWAERMAGLPPGSRLGFPDRPWPRAIVLDLAAQAAGLTSVPLREGGAGLERLAAGRGCLAWVEPDGRIATSGTVAGFDGGEPGGTGTGDAPGGEVSREGGGRGPAEAPGAGRVVVEGSGGMKTKELSQEDLLQAAAEVERLVAGGEGREILVTGGSLAEEAERRLMAWALQAGAAVVLEDDPLSAAATSAWARPTLFQGDAAALATLRRGVEATSGRAWRRRRRLPFGRLHTVLVAGSAELPAGERAFWEGRGVRLARMV